MKSILESAASEIVITIASSISIAAAASEKLAKAVEEKANAMTMRRIIKDKLTEKKLAKLKALIRQIKGKRSNTKIIRSLIEIENFLELFEKIIKDEIDVVLTDSDRKNYLSLTSNILNPEMEHPEDKFDFINHFKIIAHIFDKIPKQK